MVKPLVLIPPLAFAALAAVFLWGMERENADDLPSTFIGRQAPPLPEAALPGYPGLGDGDLRTGEITLVNFWASWCPPCRAEHPKLKELAGEGVRIAGVNFKDDAGDATAYLAREGNPFFGVAFDPDRKTAIDWGTTAPPETFIVDGDGTVLYRFVGPLVGEDYENRFLPELKKAQGKAD